jgi:mRNA-degrading endonuclease toxin of MazEF toxin-antitoxin module
MERGDIYLVKLDPIVGREQAGERRVLVLTTAEFNRVTSTPLVAPITIGGGLARMEGFSVSLTGTGLQTQGIVRCDQVRALDLRGRGAKRLEMVPDYIVDDVLAKVTTLFE